MAILGKVSGSDLGFRWFFQLSWHSDVDFIPYSSGPAGRFGDAVRMRRPRSLLLLLSLLAATSVGIAFLTASGFVGFWDAVRTLAFGSVLAVSAVLALLVRRTNQQLRQLRTGLDRQVRHIREITGENRVELLGRTAEIADRLSDVERTLREEAGSPAEDRAGGDPKAFT